MIFAIPRDSTTYVGTTDTDYDDGIERPKVTQADVDYVLQAANNAFDIEPLTQADILSTWAGLRPLIHEDGRSPSELSRKDEIFISEHGLISIAGGKLTGYRKMAERTVDLALKQLQVSEGKPFVLSRSSSRKLSGGSFHSLKAFLSELGQTELNANELSGLFHRYGSNAIGIIAAFDKRMDDRTLAILLAELNYCVENESVNELSDFLIRRTGRLYFEHVQANKYAEALNNELSALLQWDMETAATSLNTYMEESRDVLNFIS